MKKQLMFSDLIPFVVGNQEFLEYSTASTIFGNKTQTQNINTMENKKPKFSAERKLFLDLRKYVIKRKLDITKLYGFSPEPTYTLPTNYMLDYINRRTNMTASKEELKKFVDSAKVQADLDLIDLLRYQLEKKLIFIGS